MAVAANLAVAARETRADAADFALVLEEFADPVCVVGIHILIGFRLAVHVESSCWKAGLEMLASTDGKPIIFGADSWSCHWVRIVLIVGDRAQVGSTMTTQQTDVTSLCSDWQHLADVCKVKDPPTPPRDLALVNSEHGNIYLHRRETVHGQTSLNDRSQGVPRKGAHSEAPVSPMMSPFSRL